ncbi:MAG: LuxR family transcriptional regulator [Spirochaetes bacterium]|nr:MAG: LuxR family transcriptional regulator [Spirochaetota bacterium]
MVVETLLREREKELACIYSICLLAASAPDPRSASEGVAKALCAAMRFDQRARCRIDFCNDRTGGEVRVGFRDEEESGRLMEAGLHALSADLPPDLSGGWTGTIILSYPDPSLCFLPQEKALLESVLVIVSSMLRTAELFARLRATSENLASKNTALREVLSVIEEEKAQVSRAYKDRLALDILPLAERAKDMNLLPERREAYLTLLIDEIKRQMSAILPGREDPPALSPREREIALQVRNGRTSKEIAEILGIAEATVERHRHNIRKKLRLINTTTNLTSLLSQEPTP